MSNNSFMNTLFTNTYFLGMNPLTSPQEVIATQQPEWLMGFASGVCATLLGFLLTMAWDIYKYNRDKLQKDKTTYAAIKYEIRHNLEIANANIKAIKKDIEAIKEGKTVIASLHSLHSNLWEIIKLNMPKILEKSNFLSYIQDISLFTEYANEQIKSRENWRVNNQLLSNYHSRLTQYDDIIINLLVTLIKKIKEFEILLLINGGINYAT